MDDIFLLLVLGHFLADFGLQNQYVADNKAPGKPYWWWCMSAHCSIHSLMVFAFTGSIVCCSIEFFAHFIIDCLKCRKVIGYNLDQTLHILCKAAYVAMIALGLVFPIAIKYT